MAKATVAALQDLRRPEDVAKIRGKRISEVLPLPAVSPQDEEPPDESMLGTQQVIAPEPAVEETPGEEPATEEAPLAEETPVEEPATAAEPEAAAEAPAEEPKKRRGLRRKKDDS
jgi:hypothetical protein